MPQKTLRILGLNPGTRYLGLAVFQGPELRDWAVKTFKGRWSQDKQDKIKVAVSALIDRYDLNALAIKDLHPSRSSAPLDTLATELKDLAREKGLKIYTYSLQELESYFQEESRINKKTLADILVQQYPALFQEFNKERENKNPYFWRLFEAVALGAVCYRQNENNN